MENVATNSNNSGVKTRSKTRQENVNSKMPGNSSSTSSVPRKDKPTARPQGKQGAGQPLDVSKILPAVSKFIQSFDRIDKD